VKKLVRGFRCVRVRIFGEVRAECADGHRVGVLERSEGAVLVEEGVVVPRRGAKELDRLARDPFGITHESRRVERHGIGQRPVEYAVRNAIHGKAPAAELADKHGRFDEGPGVRCNDPARVCRDAVRVGRIRE
jgi:hypothetical protein